MKRIGIVCAMDSEFATIKAALTNGTAQRVGLQTFYTGDYHGKHIIAATCGIGKVNAAACTQTMISKFGAECILNSGVAGALSSKVHILDFVIATETVQHDLDEQLMKNYFPKATRFPVHEPAAALVAEICTEKGFTCLRGKVATGDQFICERAVKNDILGRTQADAVEMESAAIGQVCYINEIPCVIIRCISDCADDSGEMDFDTFVVQAAERSADLTLTLLQRLA